MLRLKNAISLLGQALIFPQACCLCEQPVLCREWVPLCTACFSKLRGFRTALCPVCGIPSAARCVPCRTDSIPYSCARAYGPYLGDLRDLIWSYKFKGFRRLSYPLSRLLLSTFGEHFKERPPDLLMAVPSNPERLAERGFDHVGRLVRSLSHSLGLPFFQGLRREVNTLPQFGLNMDERVRNLEKAFSLEGSQVLDGRAVLLVDDVMTTGTTVVQVCKLLRKQSSVDRIDVLTIARVPRFQRG